MAHRVNTGNFENGQEKSTVASWKKFFTRHWQFATESELMESWQHIPEAVRAIQKMKKDGCFEN